MSLRGFHIFFIALSILLTFGFGFWALRDYSASRNLANLLFGAGSLIGGAALIIYLSWFLRKTKKIALVSALLLYSSKTTWACSVCFGDSDSASSKGVTFAVLFLMGVVGVVLGAIAVLIIRWTRRASRCPAIDRTAKFD